MTGDPVLQLVGLPYVFGSRDPSAGLDCLTLAAEVYRRIGRSFPMPAAYERNTIGLEEFERAAQAFEVCDPEPWALVLMSDHEHCGVLLEDARTVIHCRKATGVVVQRLRELRPLVDCYMRPREVRE